MKCTSRKGLLLIGILLACAMSRVALGTGLDEPVAFRRIETGAAAQFMPIGWFNLTDPAGRSFRAYPALGGNAFIDYRLGPIMSIGVGAEITANVIPNQASYVTGIMYDATVRVGARYPMVGRFEPYGMVTAGYSVISFSAGMNSARGLLAGVSAGVQVKLGSRQRIFGQLGYQHGFQAVDGSDYAPSYVVTTLGWLMAL